ncbi:MAG: T9SS type A sorting domain-containing protein [Bacteroidia bacterium]
MKKYFPTKNILIAGILLATLNFYSQWQSLTTGLSGGAGSFTTFNNKLIVGGSFTIAGGNAAQNIAAWDGINWSTLGQGLNGTNGPFIVSALTVYNSDLIAAGTISASGTTTLCNIAKWNGTSWAPIVSSMTSDTMSQQGPYISALIIYNNKLIAAGNFTAISGVPANNIAQWDGTNWSPLGSGLSHAPAFTDVRALTVYNNELYAGGFFSMPSILAANVAKWNGSNWSAAGYITDCAASNISVMSLCEYNGELYAGNCVNGLSKLSGGNWITVGGGIFPNNSNNGPRALLVYDNQLIVAGGFSGAGSTVRFNITTWDGANWNKIGGIDGFDVSLFSLAVYNSCLYAGGLFNNTIQTTPIAVSHISNYCGPLGVKENAIDKISIFPNPTSGKINFEGLNGENKIVFYDLFGRVIFESEFKEPQISIDLNSKKAGMYLYKITNKSGLVNQGKIIIN